MLAVGIIGGAGYTGAELLRLLAMHDEVEVKIVTSRDYAGIRVDQVHGHLAGHYEQAFVNPDKKLLKAVHTAIKEITEDLDGQYQFNTAISELMKLSNTINKYFDKVDIYILSEAIVTITKLLAPFAPHIAEEMWMKIGGEGSVHQQQWPNYDKNCITKDTVAIVIQVKGKVRGSIEAPKGLDKKELEKIALESDVGIKWLEGKAPSRIIVVPDKLVNLVP